MSWFNYILNNLNEIGSQSLEHLMLTAVSVSLACIVSIPLGILIYRKQKFSAVALNSAGILQTIPSIALLGFMIPILGIGVKPAIIALFLYSLLPILRNTFTGLNNIDKQHIEAADALGMTAYQKLMRIELPLAASTIIAGIRTATVINVGVATLAAYIAAGGLGEFIFGGIALNNTDMIIAGALPSALLAIILDSIFSFLQKRKFNLKLLFIPVILITVSLLFSALGKNTLLAGFTPEFVGRKDGYFSLKENYKLKLETRVLNNALMYEAVRNGEVDVISGYSTDGRIEAYDLRVLEDNKNSFPPYEAALLMNEKSIAQFPGLTNLLNGLSNRITNKEMQNLNFKVDHRKLSVEKVAGDFLKSLNIQKDYEHLKSLKGKLRLGSKVFTEQYILVNLYKKLIEKYTSIEVQLLTGLGGTKICFDALNENEIDAYIEYSGTALQVLLNEDYQPEKTSVNIFNFVQRELKDRFDLIYLEPLGFNNTYALMMRREQANGLGINSISDLAGIQPKKTKPD